MSKKTENQKNLDHKANQANPNKGTDGTNDAYDAVQKNTKEQLKRNEKKSK